MFTATITVAVVVLCIHLVEGIQIQHYEQPFKRLEEFNPWSFKAQFGQDKWLYHNVFGPLGLTEDATKKNPAYFVEFGARDGVQLSNTYFFEKQLGWQGVLIEAGLDDSQKLPNHRACRVEGVPAASCLHAAVLDEEGKTLTFQGEGLTGKNRHLNRVQSPVVSTTLNAIVRDFRLPRIDLLSVDCEGCELPALQAFEFSIPVQVLLLEKGGKRKDAAQVESFCKIKQLLTAKGFLNIRVPGWAGRSDEVFVSRDVAAQIPKPAMLPAGQGCAADYTWEEWPTN